MLKLLTTLILLTLCLSACINTESPSTSNLPKSSIIYQGDKYMYSTSYTHEEIKTFELTSTGELTGEDDGAQQGLEIYKDLNSNSIFIKDESNSTRPWLRYSREEA